MTFEKRKSCLTLCARETYAAQPCLLRKISEGVASPRGKGKGGGRRLLQPPGGVSLVVPPLPASAAPSPTISSDGCTTVPVSCGSCPESSPTYMKHLLLQFRNTFSKCSSKVSVQGKDEEGETHQTVPGVVCGPMIQGEVAMKCFFKRAIKVCFESAHKKN